MSLLSYSWFVLILVWYSMHACNTSSGQCCCQLARTQVLVTVALCLLNLYLYLFSTVVLKVSSQGQPSGINPQSSVLRVQSQVSVLSPKGQVSGTSPQSSRSCLGYYSSGISSNKYQLSVLCLRSCVTVNILIEG